MDMYLRSLLPLRVSSGFSPDSLFRLLSNMRIAHQHWRNTRGVQYSCLGLCAEYHSAYTISFDQSHTNTGQQLSIA